MYCDRAYVTLGIPPRPEGMSIAEVRSHIHRTTCLRCWPRPNAAGQRPADRHTDARYRRSDGCWRHADAPRVVQRAPGRHADCLPRRGHRHHRAGSKAPPVGRARAAPGLASRMAQIGIWWRDLLGGQGQWTRRCSAVRARPGARHADAGAVESGIVHPDDREAHAPRAAHDAAPAGGGIAGARVPSSSPGRQRALAAGQPRAVGGDRGRRLVFGVTIDITERRLASERCAALDERVALAARSAGINTWEMDFGRPASNAGTSSSACASWHRRRGRRRATRPGAGASDDRQRTRECQPGAYRPAGVQYPSSASACPTAACGWPRVLDRLHRRPGPHAAASASTGTTRARRRPREANQH